LIDKLFIDECLSAALVAVAKNRGFIAEYGPYIGKGGWQDWNIVPFALENDYIIVTNNRRHFLKEYVKVGLHSGLVIIVPNVERDDQVRLFEIALDAVLALNDGAVNKLIEVLADGSVHVREWTSEEHDIGHIDNPRWR
jgi:predicted nuclease of predicted toxin-antitoxin system